MPFFALFPLLILLPSQAMSNGETAHNELNRKTSEPITQVETKTALNKDIERGKALYLSPGKGGCGTCHGETGNEPVMPMYPKIGCQNHLYLYNQLIDFKKKKRRNGLFVPMEVAMENYSDEEIDLMATYLSQCS